LKEYSLVIDIQYCGICHTDIHHVRNEWGGKRKVPQCKTGEIRQPVIASLSMGKGKITSAATVASFPEITKLSTRASGTV
jgi:hypothetical protein